MCGFMQRCLHTLDPPTEQTTAAKSAETEKQLMWQRGTMITFRLLDAEKVRSVC